MGRKGRRWIQWVVGVSVIMMSVGVSRSQMGPTGMAESEWQVGLFAGWFTGGELQRRSIGAGVPVKAEDNDGVIVGVRFGQDGEYLGWEATVAATGATLDLKYDEAVVSPQEVEAYDLDADRVSLFLVNVNAMIYPGGNEFAEGRVRPFLTVGPGLVTVLSDYEAIANETAFDWNAGLGVKFLLGEEGNTVLRVDYRWYYIMGSTANLHSSIYRQELSLGLGIRV